MAIVPRYTPNVQTRPELQQNFTVRANATPVSGAVGAGMMGLAAGMGQAAEAFQRIQELDDIARAKEADNDFASWVREAQYGEGGYLTLQGRAAVEARERFEQEAQRRRDQIAGGLTTPGAQRAYQEASGARMNRLLDQSIVHQANERKRWYNDASSERLNTFANDALVAYQNPELVERNIAAGQAELRTMAELQGWDADALASREREFISGVHKNVALRMAQDNPMAAQTYVDAMRERLSGSDQFDLERALSGPVLNARAAAAAESILSGAPVEATQAPRASDLESDLRGAGVADPDLVARGSEITGIAPYIPGQVRGENNVTANARGNFSYLDAGRAMLGMTEGQDYEAISEFIKTFAGIEIDPRQTAWCAAFVNAMLGFDGIEGTGQLNARSFLNFGTAVDEPKVGDVVVFSRGDPNGWQGHVGFFKGYDANGNILVMGGNQSNSVSVQSYSADRLLGVRRPSAGVVGDQVPVNYSPAGLAHIEQQLNQIDDPQLRDATRQQIMRSVEAQNKMLRLQRDEVQRGAESWTLANPGVPPDRLPIEMQQSLGISGMNTLWSWHDSVQSRGEPQTDDTILYQLQEQFATDPTGFAQADLFQYRDRLSNSDWAKVTGWRQSALTDQRQAAEQGANLTSAFSQARGALEAVGITTAGLKPKARAEMARREAQFNNSLAREIEAFQQAQARTPNQMEVQSMINRLLLPTVISQPRRLFPGERTEDSLLFESGGLGDIGGGRTVSLAVEYNQIPATDRVEIEIALEREFGRKPSEAEVVAAYNSWMTETMSQ